jgi:sulfur-oxidizing protein SoxA
MTEFPRSGLIPSELREQLALRWRLSPELIVMTSESGKIWPLLMGLSTAICILFTNIVSTSAEAQTAPTNNTIESTEIESEISAFQSHFRKKFPTVVFEKFSLGVVALPQYARQKLSRDLLGIIPPYQHALPQAVKALNQKPGASQSIAECLARYSGAQNFPYYFAGRTITTEGAVRDCIESSGVSYLADNPDKIAGLSAAYQAQFRGKPIAVDYSDSGMRSIYQKGRKLYWSRRGQNNFSCASCHVNNAGNRIRGDVLSPALGQSTSFPVYSPERARKLNNESSSAGIWLSLHNQYSLCYIRSGAAPLAEQSPDYIALEVYQSIMDTGLPVNSPSFRP